MKPPQKKKISADLNNPFNKYPHENFFNHPVVLKSTLAGAILAGILTALMACAFSTGFLGTAESAKISSMNPGVLAFIGFIAGIAVGGLIGNVYGIFLMLRKKG